MITCTGVRGQLMFQVTGAWGKPFHLPASPPRMRGGKEFNILGADVHKNVRALQPNVSSKLYIIVYRLALRSVVRNVKLTISIHCSLYGSARVRTAQLGDYAGT